MHAYRYISIKMQENMKIIENSKYYKFKEEVKLQKPTRCVSEAKREWMCLHII